MVFLPRFDTKALTRKRLHIEGSPSFEQTISNIGASAEAVYGFESDSEIRRYLPLNYLRIVNKGGTDLKIYIGQFTDGETIIDDGVFEYHGNFWSFKLENLSSTSTATGSGIHTNVQRKAD